MAPHGLEETRQVAEAFGLPFPVLADPERSVFRLYDVHSRLWSLGQRPGVYVVDRGGVVRWAHVGRQQWEIPSVDTLLAVLDDLERAEAGSG